MGWAENIFVTLFGSLTRAINGAPLLELGGFGDRCSYGNRVFTGLRFFGPTNDIGSEITLGVVRTTRGSNDLGGNNAMVRTASNGANVNLTTVYATGKCGSVVMVPRAVSIRHEGLVTSFNTRIMLARNTGNVGNTVRGTRRVGERARGDVVTNRFCGGTGPRTRCGAATPRV